MLILQWKANMTSPKMFLIFLNMGGFGLPWELLHPLLHRYLHCHVYWILLPSTFIIFSLCPNCRLLILISGKNVVLQTFSMEVKVSQPKTKYSPNEDKITQKKTGQGTHRRIFFTFKCFCQGRNRDQSKC